MPLTDAESRNLQVITSMAEAFNRRDLDAIVALFVPDAVYEDFRGAAPSGDRYTGVAMLHRVFAEQFAASQYSFSDHIAIVSGNHGALEYTITVSGDGERQARLCDFFEFRDGRVARKSTWMKAIAEKA